MRKRKTRLSRYLILSPIVLFNIFFISCASMKEVEILSQKQQNLEQRIAALEKEKLKTTQDLRDEVIALRKYVRKELSQFRTNHLYYLEQLESIQKDIEDTNSSGEENQMRLRKTRREMQNLKKRIGDQTIALDELRQFFTEDVDRAPSKNLQEKQAYEEAYNLYKTKQWKLSGKKFKRFRQQYPKSERYDDALFYIGYIQFLQGRYENASLHFYELLEQSPQSNLSLDAKWWLGVSLERSGDINSALDVYRSLTKLREGHPIRIRAELRLDELEIPGENP